MAALASHTLTTLPSRGCHTLSGHRGRVDLHMGFTKITPGGMQS